MTAVPPRHILTRLLVPALARSFIEDSKNAARLRTALAATAVERHRLKHGKLPDGLNDLVPEFLPAIPDDPFDGAPLRYKKLAKGYVVYSVGDDRVDDGGVEVDRATQKGDITFIVER